MVLRSRYVPSLGRYVRPTSWPADTASPPRPPLGFAPRTLVPVVEAPQLYSAPHGMGGHESGYDDERDGDDRDAHGINEPTHAPLEWLHLKSPDPQEIVLNTRYTRHNV